MKAFQNEAGATLSYEDHGDGLPVLVLHGAYSTHHELLSALDSTLAGYGGLRRLYPDLPAMGASPRHDSIQSSNDVLDLLEEFIDDQNGESPLLLIGHSFGAHLARGLALRRSNQVIGMTLICPMLPAAMEPEPHTIVQSVVDPTSLLDVDEVDEYLGYFVVHTEETVERFRSAVAPSLGHFHSESVERIMNGWRLHPDPDQASFNAPTLIVTGRRDSATGYRVQAGLLDRYPRGTYVVLADSGHALPHERPDVLGALIGDWLAASRTTGGGLPS
jgi:pimeloyl-ACP methyl ester carboxylesterase